MDKNLINKIKNEKINYIVEWWEEDSLDIDSNQHILFSLENEDIDIIVTEKNIDEINFVLEKFNVNISMEFHVNFFDRIIYPISRYGEKYYEYKNFKIYRYSLFAKKEVSLNLYLIFFNWQYFFEN